MYYFLIFFLYLFRRSWDFCNRSGSSQPWKRWHRKVRTWLMGRMEDGHWKTKKNRKSHTNHNFDYFTTKLTMIFCGAFLTNRSSCLWSSTCRSICSRFRWRWRLRRRRWRILGPKLGCNGSFHRSSEWWLLRSFLAWLYRLSKIDGTFKACLWISSIICF